MTPLNMACNRRNSTIAKMFIAANAIVNLPDATGSLPLHYIARCGDLKVARLLLDAGKYIHDHAFCSSFSTKYCIVLRPLVATFMRHWKVWSCSHAHCRGDINLLCFYTCKISDLHRLRKPKNELNKTLLAFKWNGCRVLFFYTYICLS